MYYDIEKRMSSKGKIKWFWHRARNGRFKTVAEATKAARKANLDLKGKLLNDQTYNHNPRRTTSN